MFNETKSVYWVLALVVSLLVLAHLAVRSPSFPFSPDSANYIEQARNLVEEGAALVNPYGLEGVGKAPSALFPIGFPLVLSLFQFIGIDARETSVALSWLSSIILPLVWYLSFRGALGQSFALVVAALSVTSPGFLSQSVMGLTDVFSLLLAGISVGLIINAKSRPLIIAAGLLAGVAYSVRNAHAALLVSFAVYFVVMWFVDKQNRREVVSSTFLFAIGAAAIVIPIVVRNLIVFGSINPYQMEPSTIGLLENIRTYLQEFVYDVTGYRELGRVVAWSLPGFSAFVVMLCLVAWSAFSSWGGLNIKQRRMLFLCSIYSFVGSCVVVAARSRYQWGEPINVRHTLQYTPYFIAVTTLVISVGAKSYSQSLIKYTLVFAFVPIVVIHLVYAVVPDSQSRIRFERSNASISAFEHGRQQLCGAENGNLLISNFAYVFRINCKSPVRQWSPLTQSTSGESTPSGLMTDSLIRLSRDYPSKHIVIGLYRRNNDKKDLFPIPGADSSRLRIEGWNVINNDGTGLLLSR